MGDQLMLLLIGGDQGVFVSDASGVGGIVDVVRGVDESVFGGGRFKYFLRTFCRDSKIPPTYVVYFRPG